MITIILAIITIFSIIVTIILWALEKSIASMVMLGVTIGLFLSTLVSNACVTNEPSALDVYRGNTELEITLVNGVPTDTVVVFKNKQLCQEKK